MFAPTETIKGIFIPPLKEDPRRIPIAEKLELTRHYNNIPLKYQEISTTNLQYLEVAREKYFVSSQGSEIREDLITATMSGLITSKDGSLIQNVRVGIGGSAGFAILRNREEKFESKTGIALDLLRAKPVGAGVYDVILNPNMAGVFTHEAFGHFSEADLIEDNPTMREKMRIGAKLGNNALNIVDDATMPDQLGFYKYDDEGVMARPIQLLREGILVGRLHSRRTSAAFGEPLSGHSIAEDYRFAPIIRMGNIFIQPGTNSFEELLEELGDGLYILDARGGQISGEEFLQNVLDSLKGGVKAGFELPVTRDLAQLVNFISDIYNKSLQEASPRGGKMKVLFLPDTIYGLIWRLQSATNGKNIYEKKSPVSEKLGQEIFNRQLTIYNDPLNDDIPGARSFDDEGTPCRYFPVIENGVLKNFYYDLHYADKLKASPTGHGFRSAMWGGDAITIKLTPSLGHLFIKPGDKSLLELIGSMDRGIIIAGVLGAHSGNIPNGDFSMGLSPGLYVENGEIVGNVKDAMVAGNIYEVMKNVLAIEDTLYPAMMGTFPAILFDNVSVATKS